MGCAPGDGCGVPLDAALELRFDRYLRPATAVRQSLRVAAGAGEPVFLEPEYDVIERVVTFRLEPGVRWQPGILYTVELVVADEDPRGFGFRAFDGAALEDGPVPLRFSFRTALQSDPAPSPREPPPRCTQVLESLQRGGCVGCHAGGVACPDGACSPAELDLSSAAGLRRTALFRTARQTEVGPTAGEPLIDPARFGVGMPLLSDSAATSYLVYKLLISPDNFRTRAGTCVSAHRVPLPDGACLYDADEAQRLRESFVLGEPMPPQPSAAAHARWSLEDSRQLQSWLRAGASLADCP